MKAMTSNEIEVSLKTLGKWQLQDKKLFRELEFSDFIDAFSFMTKIAFEAEKAQHHPEWFNVYNKLKIELITHDAGPAISQKDFALAHKIEEIYQCLKK